MTGTEYDESFLTVAEVAELLRLNQQTVRNWIDAGSLPAVRIGRRVRIKRSDLERILENGYHGSPPSASPISGPSATDFWSGEPVGAADPPAEDPAARRKTDLGRTRPEDDSSIGGPEPSPVREG